MKNVNVVLLHNNIVNKYGNLVETSITNIDIHDIARSVRTYELNEFSVVTRLSSQKLLLERMLNYWVNKAGKDINPDRKTALDVVKHYDTIFELMDKYDKCKLVITDAKIHQNSVDYPDMKEIIRNDPDTQYLILFGTGWGLDSLIVEKSDYILYPIQPDSSYNHLSVRAAAAIIIDRLFAF